MKIPILSVLLYLLLSLNDSACQIADVPRTQPSKIHAVFINECCHYAKMQDALMLCANASAHANKNMLLNQYYSDGGPSLGVGIVSYATQDIWEYSAFSLAVNEAYAEHNGYIMRQEDDRLSNYEPADARWNKIKVLLQALDPESGWARDLAYVMWIDADVIFLDFSLRLEKVAAQYPLADIILSAENAGSTTLVNSGTILVKNSPWARMFLNRWWSFADRRLFSDQEQFDMLYKEAEREYNLAAKIAILAPDALNSDPPSMTQQRPQNQMVIIKQNKATIDNLRMPFLRAASLLF